jgi:signal transduction histidine kinase
MDNMAGNNIIIKSENKEKILLVDDDLAFLEVAKAILRVKGYDVEVSHNAGDALSRVREGHYNLVILDIHLPDMSGVELLSSINHTQPEIIAIMLTGYSSVENSVQALNRGAFAYLEKPLKPDRLIEVIQRGLEKQRLLSENHRLIKELEQRNRELTVLLEEASNARALRELDSMRTELLANVSHELRTPLAAIKGFASSLLQPDINFDDETRKSFIQTIDSEADRLSQLIDDLLLMSKIEAGVFKAKKEWYEVSEILNTIKDRLYHIAIKHNLILTLPDNLPPVFLDGPRIGEVITNLVENAVKYSPEGSDINIEVELSGKEIVTHVTDKGIGIPKEYQSLVFDRFNQLSSKNGHRKSSGLGLSISRGIIESHHGKIWVESEPGKGSRFNFSLPINSES